MGSQLKLAFLVVVALLAVTAGVVVVYSFVTNDWRLTQSVLSLSPLDQSDNETTPPVRSAHWAFELSDSAIVVIETAETNVQVLGGIGNTATVEMWLVGEAADSTRFQATAVLDSLSTLNILARPIASLVHPAPDMARVVVTLPQWIRLNMYVAAGTATIERINGNITAEVLGPGLALSGVNGLLQLRVVGGNVSVEQGKVSGSIDAPQGYITTNLTEGDLTLSASGRLTLRNHLGPLVASSDGGNVLAELLGISEPCQITASHGNIEVEVMPGARYALDIQSGTGRVTTSGIQLDTNKSAKVLPDRLQGTINGGGASMVVRADAGQVMLREYVGHR